MSKRAFCCNLCGYGPDQRKRCRLCGILVCVACGCWDGDKHRLCRRCAADPERAAKVMRFLARLADPSQEPRG